MNYIKYIFLLGLFSFQLAYAQTIRITGFVSNKAGNPLHNAFIQDKAIKNGTYTDGQGNFSLDVNPTSSLRVNCAGYNDTAVNVNNKASLNIVLNLSPDVTGKLIANMAVAANTTVLESFRDQVNLNGPPLTATRGTIFPVFSAKEETRGSRYLFTSWQNGFVLNSKDSLIQRPDLMFNYDKIGGNLLLTQDRKSAIEIDKDLVKSFTLFGPDGEKYLFKNVPSIDKKHYVEIVCDGRKYKIYKNIKTEFVKSDYATNGITTSGNPYDEYVDKATYYVIGTDGTQKKVELRKKSIKAAFSADADKVSAFLLAHDSDDIDDKFLTGLGEAVNN